MTSPGLGPIWRSLTRQKTIFALVVVELAAGFVVLSALVLFGTFVISQGGMSSGHDEAPLVAVSITSPGAHADGAPPVEDDALLAAQQTAARELARLAAVSGVVAVAPLSISLIDDRWYLLFPVQFWREGKTPPPRGQDLPEREEGRATGWLIDTNAALPAVLGLRFVEGGPMRGPPPPGGVIITRCLRDALFGKETPVQGRHLAGENLAAAPIVAVVEDVMMQSPFLPAPKCVAFRFDPPPDERERRYVVRTLPGRRDQVIEAVREAVGPSGPDREVVVTRFDSRDGKHHDFGRGVAAEMAMVGGAVGIGALIGALALSAFLVRQRRRQIAIRRALGATKPDIVGYFLLESSVATALGTAIGLAIVLGGLGIAGLFDPGGYFTWSWRSLALSALLLWMGATLAATLPARRAADVPPSAASRGI